MFEFFQKLQILIEGNFHFLSNININITKIEDETEDILIKNGGAYCKMIEGVFNIYVHEDIRVIVDSNRFKTGTEYRFKSFFETLDVQVTKESVLLFAVLHELGHLDVFEKFHVAGVYESYGKFLHYEFPNNIAHIAQIWEKSNEIQFDQYFNVIEAQADIFAMTHFLKIWKLIQSS